MKSARFSRLAALVALAVLAGCGSDDAPDDPPDAAPVPAPDAAPAVCRGPGGVSVIESLEVGTLSDTEAPDALVPWNDGDNAQLERGSQGFTMLVVTTVIRGSGLQRDTPYPEVTLTRADGVIVAQNGVFGGPSTTDPRGAWDVSQPYLAFEDWVPDDGEVLDLRVNVNCIEIQRSLVMRQPR